MNNKRRSFLKNATIAGVAIATMAVAGGIAKKGGVVVGKSNKKEVLYKKTKEWEDFYKSAL